MKERKLKVTYTPGSEYKEQIPRIVLQGKWLKEFGFEVGEHVIVSATNGNIIISKNKN
ncbi:SymE family type I addiction module toxin [Erysipelothrix rhusiopathiae]|nr:SymE family type I addiction module toxin [Erysipelothrix rhusiopathiae]